MTEQQNQHINQQVQESERNITGCNLHLALLLYKAYVHVGTNKFKHLYYTQHSQLGMFALQLVPWTTLPDLNIGRVQAFQAGM